MRQIKKILCLALAAVLTVSCRALPAQRAAGRPEAPFFRNVSEELGIEEFAAKRVSLVDADGDGWLDVFILGSGKGGLRLLLNRPASAPFVSEPPQRRETNVAAGFVEQISKGARRLLDFTEESGLNDAAGERTGNFVIFGDVDNDGDADAFLSRYNDFENSEKPDDGLRCEILLNDGRGSFKRLENSGIDRRSETTSAAAFLDYGNDGLLDLFVGNWYRYYGKSLECYPDRLYRGTGGGRFEEVTEKLGLMTVAEPGERNSSRPTYGVTHLDLYGNGYQDILVCAYGRQWNMLWRNNGGKGFVERGEQTRIDGDEDESGKYSQKIKDYFKKRYGKPREDEKPFRANGNTFDAACADYDNDGDVDIFLAEICHSWAGPSSDKSVLCENRPGMTGERIFKRRPEAIKRVHADPERWNEGDLHAGWLDFDNDGRLDLVVASGDYPDGQFLRLFRQQEDGSFADITDRCGFDWEGCGGLTLGDFDRDGDVDILVGRSFARLPKEKKEGKTPHAALFINRAGDYNNYLCVILEGAGEGKSNRSAIGARVCVKAGGVIQMREIRGGAGHCGHQNPPEAYFGLGKAEKIDYVAVYWPNKKPTFQSYKNMPVNSYIRVKEGCTDFEVLEFK